jgi:hypothetical protein
VATFATTGSGFDTLLAIYTGTSVDQLTPLASDDDSGGAFASRVTFNVRSNMEYIVAVDGLGGQSGRIFLAWNFQSSAERAPTIVTSPSSRSVPAGSTLSLVAALASESAAQFQWFKDGVLLPDQTNNPLVIASFQQSDIGSYVLRVRNASAFEAFSTPAFVELSTGAGVATQDKFADASANVLVLGATPLQSARFVAADLAPASAGTILTHNIGSTRERGEPNHAGVIGGASRWFILRPSTSGLLAIDTIGSDFDTVLAVYTGSSFISLTLVAEDNDGAPDGIRSRVRFNATAGIDYRVVVDGVKGAQGNIALNYRFGAPPEIVEPLSDRSVIVGDNFLLRVTAQPIYELSYLWKLNGIPIPGATNAELFVARCQSSDQGSYSIEVSSPLGTAARVANVTVLGPDTRPTVVLTEPSATAFLVAPTNIQLRANAVGYALAKIDFFQNGKKIGESSTPPYGVNWTPPKAGKYTLTAKVTDGNRRTAASAPVRISVLQPVTIIRQPLPVSVGPGKTARFKVVAKGSPPLTYQWLFEETPVTNAVKSSLLVRNVQTNALGNYFVRVSNPAGNIVSTPAALTLKP